MMGVSLAVLKREEKRLKKRIRESVDASEKISLFGSLLTVRKFIFNAREIK